MKDKDNIGTDKSWGTKVKIYVKLWDKKYNLTEKYQRTAVFPLILSREKQNEVEEFDGFRRSGQGFGSTECEKPETFEQSQEMEETGFMDKVMLERHKLVKGDSRIP